MTPAFRVKLALFAIASVLATTFAWNAAQGQFWPPRNPPANPPAGIPGGGGAANIFTCPNCGYVYRGMVPPSICPGCKMRMNNGMGDGVEGPQGPANPPWANPGDRNPDNRPFFIPPPPKPGEAVIPVAKSDSFSTKKVVVIAVVVGVVAGIALLAGGAFLVIYTMRNKNNSSSPRRRPRRRDDRDD